jgi:poly-beta-1,6-N-acetyl-D-glucosamine synthase
MRSQLTYQTAQKSKPPLVDKLHFDQKVFLLFCSILLLSLTITAWSVWDAQAGIYLTYFLNFYLLIALVRMAFYGLGAVYKQQSPPSKLSLQEWPLLSIVVPAFNEDKVIIQSLRNLDQFHYPNYEIIVVDDGSTDHTFAYAQSFISKMKRPLQVVSQPNRGKSEALNLGLSLAQGEFVLCVDADSHVQIHDPISVIEAFRHEPNLAALAGRVSIAGPKSWLSKFQHLDYMIGHFQRKTLSLMGTVTIIPGPIGMFRKVALDSVGGYETHDKTFAEDAELTLRLISKGWKIRSHDSLVAHTEGPLTSSNLIRQRYRWSRGLYQALLKNINPLVQSQHDTHLALLIYMFWEQILIPVLDFSILFLLVQYFLFGAYFHLSLPLLMVLFSLEGVMAYMASQGEKHRWGWVGISLVSRLTYTNLLLVWKICSLYDELKNKSMTWDKLERAGLSPLASEEVKPLC